MNGFIIHGWGSKIPIPHRHPRPTEPQPPRRRRHHPFPQRKPRDIPGSIAPSLSATINSRGAYNASSTPGSGLTSTINDSLARAPPRQRLKETSRRPRIHQRRPHRVPYKIMHKTSLPKTHLRLRRCTFTSTSCGGISRKQQHNRKRSRRNNIPISLVERVQNHLVANQPPVHEHVNRIPVQLLQLRLTHKPTQPHKPRLRSLIVLLPLPGGGSGNPARAKSISAATGIKLSNVSRPKIW